MISQGAPITVDRDNDKTPLSLRECRETLSPEDLREDLIHSLQKHVEVDERRTTFRMLCRLLPNLTTLRREHADRMSEEDLLAGIEGLVAPEKNDDF